MTAIDSYSHDVSGEKEFGFAQAIKVGDTIYVSRQLSHDDEDNFPTRATSMPSSSSPTRTSRRCSPTTPPPATRSAPRPSSSWTCRSTT